MQETIQLTFAEKSTIDQCFCTIMSFKSHEENIKVGCQFFITS